MLSGLPKFCLQRKINGIGSVFLVMLLVPFLTACGQSEDTANKATQQSVKTLKAKQKQPASEQKKLDPFANKKMLTRLASGTVRYFKYPVVPKPPVDISFYDEKGKKHSLLEYRGKTVLLNFWAPWCDSCRHELPSMKNMRRKLDNQQFEILMINIEEDVKKGRKYLDKIGIKKLISMHDKDKAALTKLEAIGIPTSILFDCHGRELGRIKGSVAWHADAAMLLTKGLMRASGCYDEKRDML